jgi:hypothetical protein
VGFILALVSSGTLQKGLTVEDLSHPYTDNRGFAVEHQTIGAGIETLRSFHLPSSHVGAEKGIRKLKVPLSRDKDVNPSVRFHQ